MLPRAACHQQPDMLPPDPSGASPESTQASSTSQGNEQSLQQSSVLPLAEAHNGEYHAPKRRCMFKTLEKQLVRESNIRVAHYIPPKTQPPSGAATSSISKFPAVVTRQDLVTTSKSCCIPSTNGSYTSQSSCGKLSTKKTSDRNQQSTYYRA